VRYLATLIGSTDEATKRWFILAVALLLDPAAVLLLLAAAYTTHNKAAWLCVPAARLVLLDHYPAHPASDHVWAATKLGRRTHFWRACRSA
jgi:hypothetical protein